VAGALVVLLTLGTLMAVAMRAEVGSGLSGADWAAIRFTLTQSFVSALLSVLLAIPVARALARRRFWGRGVLITLLGAPFILPVIVAVLGLLAVFGRNGVLNSALAAIGLPEVSIYGFHGVVLAHVFFNLPLATRFLLQGWLAIPAERFRLAASLNAPIGRLLEWPMLRAVVPGTFLVIFLICLTSFAVALTLGGGPKATTVELAIYQAIRFDFDLGRAALLACIQFAICTVAALVAWQVTAVDGFGAGLDRVVQRWDGARIIDALWITAAALFLIVPLGGRLADQLGIVGWARLRLVILPRIRRPLGFAMGLAAALSMGDLGVIALFADDGAETLPLAMYRLMGAYRLEAAAGAGLLLVTLSLLLFWICDLGGRANAGL